MSKSYDVGAYVWPAYHDEKRSRLFFPRGMGEWESIIDAKPKFPGHSQPRVPLWGYLNEADANVTAMQIDVAAAYGVNVLIYDWYWYDRRPFLEDALNTGFLGAPNNGKVKFYIMWANHDAASIWDIRNSHDRQVVWQGGVDRREFEIVGNRLIERYFGHPSYYRVDGMPLFSIYDLANLVDGLGGVAEARAALEWLRERAAHAGLGGLHLQAELRGKTVIDASGVDTGGKHDWTTLVRELGFDSATHYQWCHIFEPKGDYAVWGDKAVASWDEFAASVDIPYAPHVTIGWDNNPRFIGYKDAMITGETPEKFAEYLAAAKGYIDAHPNQPALITVNSWNEWSEGSYLLPDTRNGYAYLEAVRRVFKDNGR